MIVIYTDGGCSGNPGPGGWAFVVSENGEIREYRSGGDQSTTNNKMELTAVINALEYAKANGERDVVILTDSQYVKNGITVWIHSWKKNGWRTSSKAPVKNVEYWVTLDKLNDELNVDWQWVKGHAGIAGNTAWCGWKLQSSFKLGLPLGSLCVRWRKLLLLLHSFRIAPRRGQKRRGYPGIERVGQPYSSGPVPEFSRLPPLPFPVLPVWSRGKEAFPSGLCFQGCLT